MERESLTNYYLVYYFLNTFLICGYEEGEAVEKILREEPENYSLIFKIIVILYQHNYIIHEDCLCVLEDWLSSEESLGE